MAQLSAEELQVLKQARLSEDQRLAAFLGPEVEVSAISLCARQTQALQGGMLAEMETGPHNNRVKTWEKYKYIECIVKTTFDFAGVSFVRLVLKRVPETGYTWKLHTAYAVNDAIQLRPDAPGKWTGSIKKDAHAPAIRV